MPHRRITAGNLIALALVAAGALWLLVEIGFVPRLLLAVMATWWPIFLIGAGLDLVLPRFHPFQIPFTAWASVVVFGVALFALTVSATSDNSFVVDHGPSVEAVDITLELSSSRTAVGPTGEDALLTATFAGEPQGEVVSDPGSRVKVEVRPLPGGVVSFLGRGRWDIGLPTTLPVSLAIEGSTGNSTVDLTRVRLEHLAIDAGSGAFSADLPGVGANYTADVSGRSGHVELRIAPGASVDTEARFRSGGASVFVGEGTDMRLTLRAGSGAVIVDLPDTAPIRLTIDDDGSGRVNIPSFLARRTGSGDTGVWESSNLAQGGRVIEITIGEAGSGALTFR